MSEKRNKRTIKKAEELFKKAKWQKTINLIDESTTSDEQIIAEGNRFKGWSYYYLGIKGDEQKKRENLEKAEECFRLALIKMEKEESVVSILNGLPLVLYAQGKKSEAWRINDKSIYKFPEAPSLWDTRNALHLLTKSSNQIL